MVHQNVEQMLDSKFKKKSNRKLFLNIQQCVATILLSEVSELMLGFKASSHI